ncbi:hypothetical protein crov537 [Cafeteria roenbergensis virus]|uniref:Tail specific protease domain-containing protein n=1 Tax=Cafeteria roenbergensis virus (strain BV-PW1) TaxID=693272 RepID=E3T5V8_CROVB|nr:hypothetical protein crov537 [Cafeteria roenbergensis virus BV-PW1]ADO67571.1 hypothetical protein crov537 [Cafeteria roenbergensis virus BV-PW1]
MEKYLSKINNFIKNNSLFKYKIEYKNKKNLSLNTINNLLKDSYKNIKLFDINNIDSYPEHLRPFPQFKYDNKNKIGLIKFYHFIFTNDIYSLRDADKIKLSVLNKLKIWTEKDLNNLIIDLTECYGNYYKPIIESLTQIIGDITLFAIVKNKESFISPVWINLKNGKVQDFPEVFRGSKLLFNKYIIILVSNSTSYVGEIVAGVFKSKNNVKIIGQETNGNLYINSTFLIDNNIYLSVPSHFIQTTDLKVHKQGKIIPDIKTNNFKESLKKAYSLCL